jgi:hypothetical protein
VRYFLNQKDTRGNTKEGKKKKQSTCHNGKKSKRKGKRQESKEGWGKERKIFLGIKWIDP